MRGLLLLMVIGLVTFVVCVPPAQADGLRPLEEEGSIHLPRWNPLAPLVEKLARPLYQAAGVLEVMGP